VTSAKEQESIRKQAASGPDGGTGISGWVFDIKRYAIHDGPGIRTTVFFKGCSLRCRWCHNPESWKAQSELSLRLSRCVRCGRCVERCPHSAVSLSENGPVTDPGKCLSCGACVTGCPAAAREIIGHRMTVAEVMTQVKKDVVFYDQSGGGATFSGGEPLMQPQFLLGLLRECRTEGIRTAVDTTCHAGPDVVREVAEAADLFLCDIKHMNSSRHEQYTGVGNQEILENIALLAQVGRKIVIRIPIIPGFNEDEANIRQTARFVQSLGTVRRIDILPYNRGGLEKAVRLAAEVDLMQAQAPGDDKMNEIADLLREYGFEVKTGG
jgi:pyruvate formate lyase activating enzyme